jgi:cytochrome c oxidase subunit 3
MSAAAAVHGAHLPRAVAAAGERREIRPGPARSSEARRREDLAYLGLLMFLGTVTMLFAAFTSAYVVRKAGADWRDVPLPAALWLNTALLAASSIALESAWNAGTARRWSSARGRFAASIGFGLAFLGGQIVAWRQMAAAGQFLPSNPRSSFFYMLTGAHGVHVIAALAVLFWGAGVTWAGRGHADPWAWTASMRTCRTFWHYLGVVWVFLLLLVTLY